MHLLVQMYKQSLPFSNEKRRQIRSLGLPEGIIQGIFLVCLRY